MPSEPVTSASAYIFPGQGSQRVGMGLELYEAEPAARAVWAEADASLAFALSSLAFHGPEDELQLTQNAQPALLAAELRRSVC
ncbi:MAG: acyltransferase domain-containing protein [Chloroflexia bacterium]